MGEPVKGLLEFARKGTASWRFAITLILVGFVSGSFGWWPRPFWSGFALADDLVGIKGSVDGLATAVAEAEVRRAQETKEQAIRLIRRQIYETERDACAKPPGQLRDLLLSQATELRSDYSRLAEKEYPQINCNAFL